MLFDVLITLGISFGIFGVGLCMSRNILNILRVSILTDMAALKRILQVLWLELGGVPYMVGNLIQFNYIWVQTKFNSEFG